MRKWKSAATKFGDRAEAGQRLAERLLHLKDSGPVVFALPRGGVPVGIPIAEALEAPIDLLLVRKVGAPGQPDLALGAVVDGDPPQTVLNEEIIKAVGVSPEFIVSEVARQLAECVRWRRLWMGGHAPVVSSSRTVILVDDGIATGATVRAALLALKRTNATRRILAVPVAPFKVAEALRSLCDEAVFLVEPHQFGAVSAFYNEFHQLVDEEVIALLTVAASRQCINREPLRREPPVDHRG